MQTLLLDVGLPRIGGLAARFDPVSAKPRRREPAALEGLHGHIDAMLEANPEIATAAIWERLAGEHATTVAYPTLRTHVTSRRAVRKTPGEKGYG
jgi:hypothetical protein